MDEKKELFKMVTDYGVPINQEGKPNWSQIREKFYDYCKYEAKSITLIEKLVQEFRTVCQEVIQREKYKRTATEEQIAKYKQFISNSPSGLKITEEEAERFYGQTNILKFIRETILFKNRQLYNTYREEFLEDMKTLKEGDLGYIPVKIEDDKLDFELLIIMAENGFAGLKLFVSNEASEWSKLGVTEEHLTNRLKYICEFFKNISDKSKTKKSKAEKIGGISSGLDVIRKKAKNVIVKDDGGNIIYPIIISSSLRLVAPGSKFLSCNLQPKLRVDHTTILSTICFR